MLSTEQVLNVKGMTVFVAVCQLWNGKVREAFLYDDVIDFNLDNWALAFAVEEGSEVRWSGYLSKEPVPVAEVIDEAPSYCSGCGYEVCMCEELSEPCED